MTLLTAEQKRSYWDDGVLLLPQALAPAWMDVVERALIRGKRQPSPHCNRTLFEGTDQAFWVDYCNYAANPEVQLLVRHSPIVDIVAELLSTRELFLAYDEVFIKEGSNAYKGTPFHQDTTYWPMTGRLAAVFWITLEPQSAAESLEFVRGSHLGPLYNSFKIEDQHDAVGFQPEGLLPPMPNIAANRDKHDLVSFAHQRGDIALFHPNIIHGGGSPGPGNTRSTLALKFYGDDFVYVKRPFYEPQLPGLDAMLKDGEPMRSPWNPRVFPRPEAPLW